MFTATQASGRKTQKAGTPMPTSHNFVHNSVSGNSAQRSPVQYFGPVPRIVGTHWLRWESMEGANG
jgi:hypothetical protein